jgi:hypothetical protein
VIEVSESGAQALGLDYNQSTTSPLTRIFNTQSAILNSLPTGVVAGAIAIQSNIWALVQSGHARVLASPKILTQDGVGASILTGDSLPIRITTPVGVGGVGAVSSQVEYINVGVTLQILPHVTGNGGVDANVFSEVSSDRNKTEHQSRYHGNAARGAGAGSREKFRSLGFSTVESVFYHAPPKRKLNAPNARMSTFCDVADACGMQFPLAYDRLDAQSAGGWAARYAGHHSRPRGCPGFRQDSGQRHPVCRI